jgi:murein DD-endopeptidase MepM/ murein hydrolase activator NlpD
MADLDYSTIKYLETLGNGVRIHYKDGKKVDAFPDGRGRYLPRKADAGTPPEEYEPWEPPPEPTDPPPTGSWAHPLPGAVLTSGFGMRTGGFHYGIDLSTTTAASGAPVLSAADMVITVAVDAYEGGNSTAGTYVKGHTPDGAYTFTYNHGADESLLVTVGQTVTAGTQLFTEGATGNVTGTHLHFEIIEGNWPNPWAPPYNNGANFIDPLPVLRSHGVNI